MKKVLLHQCLEQESGTTTKLTGLSNASGVYTKIGNIVYFSLTFNGVGTGDFAAGDEISVLGLPFVSAAETGGPTTAIGQKESAPAAW